jgi:arylsulfatase
MALDNESYVPAGKNFYMTDAITDHAASFLDEYGSSKRPFFLYVSYTAPHFPLHALPEDIAKYRGTYMIGWDALRERRYRRLIDLGMVNRSWPLTPRDSKASRWSDVKDKKDWDLKMAIYAAQIDRMDQGIGKILDKVKTLNIREDTLIMFLSDNGGGAAGLDCGMPGAPAGHPDSYMSYSLPWANASNTPFRLFKRWVHEGGIATPFIAYWPAVIKQGGRVTDQVGHVIDIMATCLDIAGVEYPRKYHGHDITPLEGKSLLPVFQGKTRPGHDFLFWEHEGNRAVRHEKWKLVSRHPHKWELYDLHADRTEMNDLASKRPEIVQLLGTKYREWAGRCGVIPYEELPHESNVVPWYRLPLPQRMQLLEKQNRTDPHP